MTIELQNLAKFFQIIYDLRYILKEQCHHLNLEMGFNSSYCQQFIIKKENQKIFSISYRPTQPHLNNWDKITLEQDNIIYVPSVTDASEARKFVRWSIKYEDNKITLSRTQSNYPSRDWNEKITIQNGKIIHTEGTSIGKKGFKFERPLTEGEQEKMLHWFKTNVCQSPAIEAVVVPNAQVYQTLNNFFQPEKTSTQQSPSMPNEVIELVAAYVW